MEVLIALVPPPAVPYLAGLGVLWLTFTSIASITPTKKDDKLVSKLDKVGAFFDRFGARFKNPK